MGMFLGALLSTTFQWSEGVSHSSSTIGDVDVSAPAIAQLFPAPVVDPPAPRVAKAIAAAAAVVGAGAGAGVNIYRQPSVAAYREATHFCKTNPFVATWSDAAFSAAAASAITYRSTVVERTHERAWGKHAPNAAGAVTAEPYVSLPDVVPCGGEFYADVDGKLVCKIESLKPGCIIYSLGSDGNFGFEGNMLKETPCEIYTFDCTLNPDKTAAARRAEGSSPRIKFFPLCLGGDDHVASTYRSLASIMKQFGHTFVDLLKMDIEGFEFRVVEALYASWLKGDAALPGQISFEQHYLTNVPVAWEDITQGSRRAIWPSFGLI